MATNVPEVTVYNPTESNIQLNNQNQLYPNVNYQYLQANPIIDYKRSLPVLPRDIHGESISLCLFSYGLTTILFNLSLVGAYENSSLLLAIEFVFGGCVLFFSGLLEWIKGNTTMGISWMNVGSIWLINVCDALFNKWGWAGPADKNAYGTYFLVWWVFTVFFLICVLDSDPLTILALVTVSANFLLITISYYAESSKVLKVAGYFGIVSGVVAYYLAGKLYINDHYKKVLLPAFGKGEVLGSPIKPKYE